jgi:hypothetical protein
VTNLIEVLKPFVDAASAHPYVAGGMVVGGALIVLLGWVREKRRAK